MSKRNQNIEDWLRQAAAQDPEVSSDQVKQQAWEQLSNMLDEGDALPLPPRSSRSGWWMIFLEALIMVGAFTLYMAVNEKEQGGVVSSIAGFTEEKYLADTATEAAVPAAEAEEEKEQLPGNVFFSLDHIEKKQPLLWPKETPLFKKELLPFKPVVSFNKPTFKTSSSVAAAKKTAEANYHNTSTSTLTSKKTSAEAEASTTSSAEVAIKKTAAASRHNTLTSTSTFKKTSAAAAASKRKQATRRSSTGAVYWNTDPLEKSPSGPEQKRLLRFAGAGNSKQTSEAIRPLITKQLFVAVKDSGVQHAPAPKIPRPNRVRSIRTSYSLKIAAILPIADAYGAAANIEYTFEWRNKWRIRPYVGAEHLTGFSREYNHRYFSRARSSPPVGSPGNQTGLNKTDSIGTNFTLNGITYGKAGVQVGYVFSKWEIGAGVEYRYVLNASGKDTTRVISRAGAPNPAQVQSVPFNKKQITGTGNLRVQLGLDYKINRRLQIGATYYMQLNRQRLDSSYSLPHVKLPDQTSFQIHLRYLLPNL